MSNWIEHDGKTYYQENYLQLANNNARRAQAELATVRQQLEVERAMVSRAVSDIKAAIRHTHEIYTAKHLDQLLAALQAPEAAHPQSSFSSEYVDELKQQIDAMDAALLEGILQIEYIEQRFEAQTGSSEKVKAQMRAALKG